MMIENKCEDSPSSCDIISHPGVTFPQGPWDEVTILFSKIKLIL